MIYKVVLWPPRVCRGVCMWCVHKCVRAHFLYCLVLFCSFNFSLYLTVLHIYKIHDHTHCQSPSRFPLNPFFVPLHPAVTTPLEEMISLTFTAISSSERGGACGHLLPLSAMESWRAQSCAGVFSCWVFMVAMPMSYFDGCILRHASPPSKKGLKPFKWASI